MVALNLLAASLLMATAVGGSLAAPAPMNVAVLPAVSSAFISTSGGDFLSLVSPLADSDEDVHIFGGDFEVSEVIFNFAGSTLSFDSVSSESYLRLVYDSSLRGSKEVLPLASNDHLIYITVSVPEENDLYSVTVDLPDLSYWDFDVDKYYISVYVESAADTFAVFPSYLGIYDGSELLPFGYADLGADVNPVDAIADGLGVIAPLGGALTDGFDAVFMDDGALTAVGMFAFILMGVGISVGITKKCFNWVTGRHGM